MLFMCTTGEGNPYESCESVFSFKLRLCPNSKLKAGQIQSFLSRSQAEYHQFEINALKAELEQLKLEQSQTLRISQVSFGFPLATPELACVRSFDAK